MLKAGNSYREVYSFFRWDIPEYYDIGVDICDRHASDPQRPALVYETEHGSKETYTFADFKIFSNRLANAFKAQGLRPGDRVGILLPQSPETAIAHIATYKCGGIAVPLFTLFGTDALEYRLADSGVKFLVTDDGNFEKIAAIRMTATGKIIRRKLRDF